MCNRAPFARDMANSKGFGVPILLKETIIGVQRGEIAENFLKGFCRKAAHDGQGGFGEIVQPLHGSPLLRTLLELESYAVHSSIDFAEGREK